MKRMISFAAILNRLNIRCYLLILVVIFEMGTEIKGQSLSDADGISDEYNFNKLVWTDECNADGIIDTTKWFNQTKLPTPGSWHNGEIQHYTDRIVNSFNDSGYMHIAAKKEEYTDQGYSKLHTSARLNSKFAFTYGRIEVRAQLPIGVGTWPSIWLLAKDHRTEGSYWSIQGFGTTRWPGCGEIDIMEHWGTNQDYVSSAIHNLSSYGATINKGGRTIPNASIEFHIYALEWTPEKLVFSVDDTVHYTYNPTVKNYETWPFDKEFYLLLNVAILPSIPADFTESHMIIDYVRIYQDSTAFSLPKEY